MIHGDQGNNPDDGLHFVCITGAKAVFGPVLGPIVGTAIRKVIGG